MNSIPDPNEPQLDLTAWTQAVTECLRRYEESATTFNEFAAELLKIRQDTGYGYDMTEPDHEAE